MGSWLGLGAQAERNRKMTEIKFRKVLNRNNLIHGLLVAPLIGSFSGFLAGAAGGVSVGLAVGLGFGLVGGFAFSFIEGAADVATVNLDNNSSVGPTTSWRLNWNYTLTVMLAIGLGTALAIGIGAGFGAGLAGGLARGLAVGFGVGLGVGLAMGLGFGLVASEAWPAFLASAQIAIKWGTPMSLMRFLEDAHSRNVLRTVGPSYQFRHARLQDRLAASGSFRDGTTLPQTSQANDQPSAAVDV